MKRLALILFCLSLTGCGYESLYSNLDERQANEMLVLLLTQNLDARKTELANSWTVQTRKSDLPHAMQILKAHGYPKDHFQTLGEVFKKEGFVSSPLEEKARLLYGLSQELSNTISTIDGVIVARVHIAIPEKNVLSDEQQPSSASVFIKHRVDSKIDTQLSAIKALIVNSVEGLAYDNVTVTLFPSDLAASIDKQAKPVQAGLDLVSVWQNYKLILIAAAVLLIATIFVFSKSRLRSRSKQMTPFNSHNKKQ